MLLEGVGERSVPYKKKYICLDLPACKKWAYSSHYFSSGVEVFIDVNFLQHT
jgi:hypothetical protein